MIWMMMILALSGGEGTTHTLADVNAAVQRTYDAIVSDEGLVDYAELKTSEDLQANLAVYADYVADLDLARLEGKEHRIAVLANAYNVLTLIGVNRAYPVDSVRDIRPFFGFFTKDEWMVGGEKMSLNDLENELLRPIDNRIHFIINCASASCPRIPREVLTRDNVEAVMTRATRDFLADETRNRFDADTQTFHLSKIFDWFRKDWGKKEDVVAFVRRYRPDLDWEPKRVKHLEYDWALNAAPSETR